MKNFKLLLLFSAMLTIVSCSKSELSDPAEINPDYAPAVVVDEKPEKPESDDEDRAKINDDGDDSEETIVVDEEKKKRLEGGGN